MKAFIVIIAGMNRSRVKLQRQPFLTPIWVLAGAAVAAFLFGLFLIWVWGTADSTTVIVIPEDPGASAERAVSLARMFGARGPGQLDAIYVTGLARNRTIAALLADRLQITPRDAPETDAKAIAQRVLREQGGGRLLVIASPDLFPALVAALSGAQGIAPLVAGDYGVIYVATVPRIGHANLLRLNY